MTSATSSLTLIWQVLQVVSPTHMGSPSADSNAKVLWTTVREHGWTLRMLGLGGYAT